MGGRTSRTMQINLIDQETHAELVRLFEDYPALRLQNNGYEYLKPEVRGAHTTQIARIEAILKKHVTGFIEFYNFRLNRHAEIVLRFEYNWGAEDRILNFRGVGYLTLDHLRDGFPELTEPEPTEPEQPSEAQEIQPRTDENENQITVSCGSAPTQVCPPIFS